MLVEVQRFGKLAQDLDREKKEWETQHGQLVQGHENVIDQMRTEFEKQQRSNWDDRDRIIKVTRMSSIRCARSLRSSRDPTGMTGTASSRRAGVQAAPRNASSIRAGCRPGNRRAE